MRVRIAGRRDHSDGLGHVGLPEFASAAARR
jgi:hypothetical protein